MTARITKSRDPILASLRLIKAAVAANAVSYPFEGDFIEAYARAYKAVKEREYMFRPRRVRKAERKAAPAYLKRLAAGPMSRVPKYMQYHGQEMGVARNYITALMHGEVAPEYVEEFKQEARNGVYWAGAARLTAGKAGRRLP